MTIEPFEELIKKYESISTCTDPLAPLSFMYCLKEDKDQIIENKNTLGVKLLHIAIWNNFKQAVDFLLENEIDPNIVSDSSTALSTALYKENIDIIKSLLKHGVLVNAQDENGRTPWLYYRTVKKFEEIFSILIQNGADLNIQDNNGDTILCLVMFDSENQKSIEGVRFMLKNGANPNILNNNGCTALHLAISYKHLETSKLLLDIENINVNVVRKRDNRTPLFDAIYNELTELIPLLLEKGADPNIVDSLFNETPLHCAVRNKNIKAFKALMKIKGIDVNTTTPLSTAIQNNHEEIVQILVENGADVMKNYHDRPILHEAIRKGNRNIVKILLTSKTINLEKTSDNETALHIAAYYGHEEIARLLLEKGSNVNAVNATYKCLKRTPLDYAIEQKNKPMITLLKKYGGIAIGKNTIENKNTVFGIAKYIITASVFFIGAGTLTVALAVFPNIRQFYNNMLNKIFKTTISDRLSNGLFGGVAAVFAVIGIICSRKAITKIKERNATNFITREENKQKLGIGI